MDSEGNEIRIAPGCGRPAKGCALVLALMVVLFVGFMVYAFRTPAIRGLVECQANMREVGAALARYNDVVGSYPPDLEAIKDEYLRDPAVLRCPFDKSLRGTSSYVYHRPTAGSPARFVVLECRLHRLSGDLPDSRLVYLKNGKVETRFAPTKQNPTKK